MDYEQYFFDINSKKFKFKFFKIKGISFLSMKNMLMIEYLTNLLYMVHLKMSGKQIRGSKCVERLAELRCVNNYSFKARSK